MAGDADDPIGADQPARLLVRSILLADMDAIAARLGGEIGPVVEQEGGAAPLRDRLQDVAGAPDVVIGGLFQAKLHAGDVARVEGLRQRVAKAQGIECRRRHQIEPAACGGLHSAEPLLSSRPGRCG